MRAREYGRGLTYKECEKAEEIFSDLKMNRMLEFTKDLKGLTKYF
jgi:hypothetical protein